MPKSVPLKKWKEFLKAVGLKHIRTKSSHEIWDKEGLLRPVTVDNNYPDVPELHIHTTLKTLGMTSKDFKEIMKKL